MFGRIRASTSSLDSLEGPPSKILKDDSFSIYEATLMKLKLGAQRDISSSKEMDEVINDCSISSPCAEEANCTPATIISPVGDGIMMMDTDCSSTTTSTSPSFGDHVSAGNSEQRRSSNSNVSILHFYKFKDPGHSSVSSSSCAEPTSTKNGSSGIISSSSIESRYRSEMERVQTLRNSDLSE
ncbi:uncharacterized protein LOC133309747 [Gastrolobium bilobum]|uniref:uncharacterized protein LOC133309747 n=1 Tax=Gastrolobium bilobum TaxID=150636 RepID=UPI002AB0621E|nr:uncharacterized protein LOC133309747 [Gastrolobium bilobum]